MGNIKTIYTDGENTSPILRDLVGDKVTINPSFVENKLIFGNGDKHRSYAVTEHETMFKEIKVLPYEEACGYHKEAKGFGHQKVLRHINSKFYLEAFEKAISDNWDSSKFNLIFHSSGFDSRLIGHFIKKKYMEDPGLILLVCWGREYEAFEDIMKHSGWQPHQYYRCSFFKEDTAHSLDFTNAWKHINGGSTHIPSSMYHMTLDHLKEIGKVPGDKEITVWTGLDNNSMFVSRRAGWDGNIDNNYKRIYYSWAMRMWGVISGVDNIQPCMDIEIGKVLFTSVSRKDNMRRKLLAIADLELSELPYVKPSRARVKVTDSMVSDFKDSYYYQNVEQAPIPKFNGAVYLHEGRSKEIKDFWRKWTGASLIDELVRRGVSIG